MLLVHVSRTDHKAVVDVCTVLFPLPILYFSGFQSALQLVLYLVKGFILLFMKGFNP